MKVWVDGSRTEVCYVLEKTVTAVLPVKEYPSVNQAEYIALVYALEECIHRSILEIDIYTDSQVMAFQLKGQYKCRAINLRSLKNYCEKLLGRFPHWSITWVSRDENKAGKILEERKRAKC